jgi:polysaccharide export outer membrane protein
VIRPRILACLSLLLAFGAAAVTYAAAPTQHAQPTATPSAPEVPAGAAAGTPLQPLGPQDSVTVRIDEDPTPPGAAPLVETVADDGTLQIPYVGGIKVSGLSTAAAARRAEQALKDGKFFLNPHVSITMSSALSQRVSVLGEVKNPGRYPIDSRTSILDLIAQAGGFNDTAADVIYVSRTDSSGNTTKLPINLKGLGDPHNTLPDKFLRGGDSVYVPRGEQFYILGEVQKPDMYRLQPNMTVLQAISLAGGVTAKGSTRRVEIKRRGPKGVDSVVKPKLDDFVQPDDVIRVKESIF